MTARCIESACDAVVSPQSRTGRCRACALRASNADPDFLARQKAGLDRYYADPAIKAASLERMHAGRARWQDSMSDDARDRQREQGRWLHATHASRPEVKMRQRKANAARVEAARNPRWCPPAKLEAYRALVAKGCRVTEARDLIEQEIALEAKRKRLAAKREVAAFERAARQRRERDQRDAY